MKVGLSLKNHFNFVKTQENHMSLEFKSSVGQRGTHTLQIFSFGAKSEG